MTARARIAVGSPSGSTQVRPSRMPGRPMRLGASNQVLQAKLRVGAVNDPLEHEADRVADAVVSGAPLPVVGAASAGVQAKCAECEAEGEAIQREAIEEEEDETIQTKAEAGGSAKVGAPAEAGAKQAASAVASGGAPLSAGVRGYFEPRFGRDLSGVRFHTGGAAAQAARGINARAYTLGRDIAFASGEYAPATRAGRRLIAHELAHVVQQGEPAIRRSIHVDTQVSLDSYFASTGVTGVTEDTKVYSRASGGATTNVQGVLIPMLSSPRQFVIDGADTETAVGNLKDHVNARLGIVAFASQKKYSFASVSGFTMNPQYYTWDASKLSWAFKPGVDKQAAWDDLNVHPELYAIGCQAARDLTQAGGSKGSKFIDMPSSDESDWVPGDAGYVKNTKYAKGQDIAYLGENIIYTGEGKFWGHLKKDLMYLTLDQWKTVVKNWSTGGGAAVVDSERELPKRGRA
jgi:hypothetical protein